MYRDDEPATPHYVRCSNACCQGSGFQWAEPGVFCEECGAPLCRLCGEDACLQCQNMEKAMKDLPDGPWSDEPDEKDFQHCGLDCSIIRMRWGSLCGYVRIEEGHPLFSIGCYDELKTPVEADPLATQVHATPSMIHMAQALSCGEDIKQTPDNLLTVHGGVTWSGERVDGDWWIGFDCGHWGDLKPADDIFGDGVYRTFEYVEGEVKSLAEQLNALACAALRLPADNVRFTRESDKTLRELGGFPDE